MEDLDTHSKLQKRQNPNEEIASVENLSLATTYVEMKSDMVMKQLKIA